MSKQSDAKKSQGYRVNPKTCSSCAHFKFDVIPIQWMKMENEARLASGRKPEYDLSLPGNQRESNLRCGIGKFAVKKSATCDCYALCKEGGAA